ncbi:response regulator transcription factor [Prosthecobacter sp.]|jgi:DNA-binding NarL/FixJ family response regulator|uniref:response regulator transcription factor n=1 Tax=Prosthecobacter sp. TaxID=1965333 RepID=UPI0037C6D589
MSDSTSNKIQNEPQRLAVVDDHAIIRGVFLTLVEDDSDLTMAWMAASLTEARAKLERDVPDFLVMDVELPDGNGFEFILEVLKQFPLLPVLMVSAQTDKSYPTRAKACGAKGFIGKEASLERLVDAVSAIQKGGVWFTGTD